MPDEYYNELKALIEDVNNKEIECRNYLQYAKDLLINDTALNYVDIQDERPLNLGRSDYIVVAQVWHGGEICRRAYIWELKAPQCFLFIKDTESRLKPSEELVDAENKLLHYYHELKNGIILREQFEIMHQDDICLGGIIIGCEKNKVGGELTEARKKQLYHTAKATKEYLYGNLIKLKTWDEILDHLK
jgi:hypothetical protein